MAETFVNLGGSRSPILRATVTLLVEIGRHPEKRGVERPKVEIGNNKIFVTVA